MGEKKNLSVSTSAPTQVTREAAPVIRTVPNGEISSYFGKCQYKTGKCYNERTLKRNGAAHSLCEEHRVKQNMIQRRSDRKYQTVHAIRRRERSQRRAVLKKQVSMAVAQQLFYEHQQQKTLGIPLPQHHPLHVLIANANDKTTATPNEVVSSAAPVQRTSCPLKFKFCPQSSHGNHVTPFHRSANVLPTGLLLKREPMPTTAGSCPPKAVLKKIVPSTSTDQKNMESLMNDSFGYMPIATCSGNKETWSDDDIEFLQTVLLA
ncbi:hypothetical protein CCR75_006973 [Bremia lactucae]|uniref:Uncharacterized protein n=1 Tax=Bremia lactucae TaxID=4779 RepID=A0A976FLS9_BRELC|nr:hypothetical protein CCR75_006973 [Bremia lactucae]